MRNRMVFYRYGSFRSKIIGQRKGEKDFILEIH